MTSQQRLKSRLSSTPDRDERRGPGSRGCHRQATDRPALSSPHVTDTRKCCRSLGRTSACNYLCHPSHQASVCLYFI